MPGNVMAMRRKTEEDVKDANKDDLAQMHELADVGDADALYRLGMRYARGEGVVKDVVIGSRLVHLAAQKGHVEAERALDSWWGD